MRAPGVRRVREVRQVQLDGRVWLVHRGPQGQQVVLVPQGSGETRAPWESPGYRALRARQVLSEVLALSEQLEQQGIGDSPAPLHP